MTQTQQVHLPHASLVTDETFRRVAGRIAKDNNLGIEESRVIFNETLGFLKAIADNPGHGMVPSEAVDMGWHAFLLYTIEYVSFGHQNGGRFIHHVPSDYDSSAGEAKTIKETVTFLVSNGYAINASLWPIVAHCGNQCGGDGGRCHDSIHASTCGQCAGPSTKSGCVSGGDGCQGGICSG